MNGNWRPSSLGIAVCALRFLYKVTLEQPWLFDDLIRAPKKPLMAPGCDAGVSAGTLGEPVFGPIPAR